MIEDVRPASYRAKDVEVVIKQLRPARIDSWRELADYLHRHIENLTPESDTGAA